ncbi:MAG TPA: hypothetical protein VJQ43_00380 [Thermoplasmata archaeon]|nr:hypothetical protein [Thermoplasmata archaeon]
MEEPSAPDEPSLSPDYLESRIVVPGVLGLVLLAAAPLVWVGARGSVAGLLVLYYGGILCIVAGVVLAFIVGVFVLGTVAVGGIIWIGLERTTLAFGPAFGWTALALAACGLILLVGPSRRARVVAQHRRAWNELRGGSVPP